MGCRVPKFGIIHESITKIWAHILFVDIATDFDWLWQTNALENRKSIWQLLWGLVWTSCDKFPEDWTKFVACEHFWKSKMVEYPTWQKLMSMRLIRLDPSNPTVPTFFKTGHIAQLFKLWSAGGVRALQVATWISAKKIMGLSPIGGVKFKKLFTIQFYCHRQFSQRKMMMNYNKIRKGKNKLCLHSCLAPKYGVHCSTLRMLHWII